MHTCMHNQKLSQNWFSTVQEKTEASRKSKYGPLIAATCDETWVRKKLPEGDEKHRLKCFPQIMLKLSLKFSNLRLLFKEYPFGENPHFIPGFDLWTYVCVFKNRYGLWWNSAWEGLIFGFAYNLFVYHFGLHWFRCLIILITMSIFN